MRRCLLLCWAAAISAMLIAEPQTQGRVDPGRLSADLTGVGAERGANADGTIPAYTGGLPVTAVDPAVGYVDPFAEDRPLFTVTAANADTYKQYLSTGHATLLKRDARTFRMNVYPTRRSAAYPDAVLATIKAETGKATTEGYHIRGVGKTTVPFPIPTDPLQVMWNHVYRWRGGSFERQFTWAPVAPAGSFFVVRVRLKAAFDQQGYTQRPAEGRLYSANQYFLSPPSAIGIRQVQWEATDPVDEARIRWLYVPATLDGRRLPSYGYDNQELLTGGMRLADQNDGWNGAPDRYDWKLLGKREMFIGYNAYRLADKRLRYADIIRPRNLDPDLLRYERHRVWVVEATRRASHIFYRRVFYIDEDTWQVALEEVYDEKGALTHFGDHHMMQFYDVQVPWYAATLHHTIGTGAYLVTYLQNQEQFRDQWGFQARPADFTPANLRNLGLP